MKRIFMIIILAIAVSGCAAHPSGKAIWEPKTKAERELAEKERQERRDEVCHDNSVAVEVFNDKWDVPGSVLKGAVQVLTGVPMF